MKFVYLIQNQTCPEQRYVGITQDITIRLAAHNAGQSPHTAKYKPWQLVVLVAFEKDERALAFEHYLKTGSGRAFANRHLW